MVESLFYDNGGVRITRTVFEVPPGKQYQIRNINAVQIVKKDANLQGPIVCIVIGVLLLAVFVGILVIALGIWWWVSLKPTYGILLSTSSGEVQGYGSQNYEHIREIQSALNAAMAQLS